MSGTTATGTPTAALAVGAVGGFLLLGATLLPWSASGAGSAISVRRVADLVLEGAVDAWVPRWAGLVVYCIPLGGALVLIGLGLGGRRGLRLAGAGNVLALLGIAVALIALDRLPRSGVGGGTFLACGGILLGTIGTGAGWRSLRLDGPPHRPPR